MCARNGYRTEIWGDFSQDGNGYIVGVNNGINAFRKKCKCRNKSIGCLLGVVCIDKASLAFGFVSLISVFDFKAELYFAKKGREGSGNYSVKKKS